MSKWVRVDIPHVGVSMAVIGFVRHPQSGHSVRVSRGRVTASFVAFIAVGVGCGSAPAARLRGSTSTPACAVVTADDVERVIHTPVATEAGLPSWDCSYVGTHFSTSKQPPFSSAIVSLQQSTKTFLARYFRDLRTGHVTVRPTGAASRPTHRLSAALATKHSGASSSYSSASGCGC